MEQTVDNRDGIKIVRLNGNLLEPVHEVDDFVADLTDLLDGRGARLVLDLGGVPYMNSAGLSALVRVSAQANVQESRVVLANLPPFVAGVLQTTKLDNFFEIRPTVDDAVQHLT